MRISALHILSVLALSLSAVYAAEEAPAPAAPPTPPAATATSEAAPAAPHDAELSPRIDSWYEGTLTALQPEHGVFTLHGGPMPYATAYARMLRELRDKLARLPEGDLRRRVDEDVRNAWQDRLTQAKSEKLASDGVDMHFQLPARGAVAMLSEGEAPLPAHLNWDRGFADRGNPAAPATPPPAIKALGDFHVGDRLVVGYASESPDRANPDALALIREIPPEPPAPVEPVAPPPAPPVEMTTTIVYETDASDRDPFSATGHTIHHGLKKGVKKFKHFFTGGGNDE